MLRRSREGNTEQSERIRRSATGACRARLPAPGEDWATCAGHLSAVRWSAEPGLVCAERAREDRGGRGGAVGRDPSAALRQGPVAARDPSADGAACDTIRRAINSSAPPVYRRAPAGSKRDAFKDEICRPLRDDPKLPGVRIRELLEPLARSLGGADTEPKRDADSDAGRSDAVLERDRRHVLPLAGRWTPSGPSHDTPRVGRSTQRRRRVSMTPLAGSALPSRRSSRSHPGS